MLEFQLSGVPRTLLIPLWSRAKATRANSRVISDPKAVEILERLEVDFGELERGTNPTSEFFQVARARALDDLIRAFLTHHPQATVVSLGAGLDTAFYRVDNGRLRWFDVDLAPVIELRRKLIPETNRSRCIAASLLDPEWVREIGPMPDGVFLFASGVLIYFSKAELRRLFAILVDSFPGGELAFDTQSKFSAMAGNIALRRSGMGTARLRWGVRTAAPIMRLNQNLGLIDQFVTFSKFAADYFTDERLKRAAKVMDMMRTMTIVHVRVTARILFFATSSVLFVLLCYGSAR
jgi:O-methyltransferase involved in polyketide biosynthesis